MGKRSWMCGLLNSNDLLKSFRLVHFRYVKAMEKAKVNDIKNRKQKRKMIEIAEVTEKKRAAEFCIKSPDSDFEFYSIAAEEKRHLSFLDKANFFHGILRKKKELISELGCALEKLNDESKNI